MEIEMKKRALLLALVTAAGTLSVATAAQAHWTRFAHTHVVAAPVVPVAPCAYHGCSGSATVTVNGSTVVTRSGSASCANNTCSGTRTVTGPNGSATVTRSISR